MLRNIKLVFILFISTVLSAQDGFKSGKIDKSLVEMDVCPFDSSAGAYYILNYGETGISHNLEIEFTHVVRMKIVSKSEFDRADITIPYNDGTSVLGLKAYTYNIENGELVATKVDKSGIFKEKVNDNYSNLNFTFPNVKEGSVIEYTYRVNYGNYRRLNTWHFQTSIPVMRSEYHVIIPEYFDYQRLLTGYVPLAKGEISNENGHFGNANVINRHHHYVALNVPAFENEPYMASKQDVISKIDFELRSINVPGSIHETYLPNTFGQLVANMLENEYWSKDIDNAPFARDVLEVLLTGNETDQEKAQKIFGYIKKFEKADESAFTLRAAFKDERGSDHDLNRLLVAVLREAGLQANPVRISTRSHGNINPFFPMYRSFNFVIVKLDIGEETYLLDASEKEHVFGVLPKYCINDRGLVIKPGPEEWVALEPYSGNGQIVQAKLELSEDAVLSGELIVRRKGYEAWEFDEELKEEGEVNYLEEFEKSQENWFIDNHEIDNLDDPFANQETIELEMEGQVEELGDLLYVNPIVYGQLKANPFKTADRKFPVSYGSTVSNMYICEILLPEGVEVESLPQPVSVALPGRAGSLVYQVSAQDNKISISQRLKISKTDFAPEEYAYLREFYAQVVEKQGEQIVLKRL